MKSIFVFLVGVVAFLVLMAPSVINDIIPVVGGLDEAAATAVLLACARYFGFDWSRFFGKKHEAAGKRRIVEAEETQR